MPPVIHRLKASGKLQAAALKADKAIQNLNKMSDADSEVVAVLVAYYEELRKRYQHLRDFEESQTENPVSEKEPTAPPQLQETGEEDKDADEQTTGQKVCIDQLEDGTLKFTLPPKVPDGKPLVYILNSTDYVKKDPIHNVIITANELIRITIQTVASYVQLLREPQLEFLENVQEGLHAQKDKIDLLLESGGSPLATEVAAKLYLDDAFRYFQNSRLLLQDLGGVDFNVIASDIGQSELGLVQSRFHWIKQTDSE